MTTRLIFILTVALAIDGCKESVREPETSANSVAPIAVKIATVSNEQWPVTYEATGTVRARSSTVISAKWMGYVREVNAHIGDRVSAGQMLASLDGRELDAASNRAAATRDELTNTIPEADSALTAAKAHLELSEATHRRMRELYDKKSISDQEFDESTAKLKAAQADLAMAQARRKQLDDKLADADQAVEAARVNRSYAEIHSPVAGIVTAKSVEPGTLAVPGMPMVTIESGGFRLEASVDESKISLIRLGAMTRLQFDGVDRPTEGRVSEIVPTVDGASRSYVVKVDVPPPSAVRSGLFGRAAFSAGSRQVLTVPQKAVIERGQLKSVFVADGGVGRTRLITTGSQDRERTEVLSGLSSGEKVIVSVPPNLADGSRIEVQP